MNFLTHFHQTGKNPRANFLLQSVAGAGTGESCFFIIFLPDSIIQLVFEVGGDQCHLVVIVVAAGDEMIENGQLPIRVPSLGLLIDHQYLHVNIRIDELSFRDIFSITMTDVTQEFEKIDKLAFDTMF